MPGVMIRKPRVKRLLVGERTALTVCQAISIAITVVLPLPVAIFMARRTSSGLACSLAPRMCSQMSPYCLLFFGATSVSQMIGLDGLDLAEERAHILEGVVPPMGEQARRRRGNAPISLVLESAPAFHVRANSIDDRGRIVFLSLGG